MARQSSSSKSISSKSTINTAVTATSYSTASSSSIVRGGSNKSPGAKSITPSKQQRRGIISKITTAVEEIRSPSISSDNTNDNMVRVSDRSGAFPVHLSQQQNGSSNNSVEGAASLSLHSKSGSTGSVVTNGGGGGGESVGSGTTRSSGASSSIGKNSNSNNLTIPQSPGRRMTAPPTPPSTQRQTVNLTPKIRSTTTATNNFNSDYRPGIPRTPSRRADNNDNNTVASNSSHGSNTQRLLTPTQQQQQQRTPTRHHRRNLSYDSQHSAQQQQIGGGLTIGGGGGSEQYMDDNATHASHATFGSNGSERWGTPQHGSSQGMSGRFVSTPSSVVNGLTGNFGGFGDVSSVASNSSGPRFVASVSGDQQQQITTTNKHGVDKALHDNVKQKGIAKRKRKEYAKDPKYTPVRRVVDELNKAIGPDKRHSAIERACIEFDHDNELQHNAELYLGAANVLCLVLSMSDHEDEICSICYALEMVYRAEREAVIISYQDVGAALVPLLLRLLERCEKGRKVINSEATIGHISRILLHMTRISELRVPLVGHPGMLAALDRVATLPLSMENRILRMRLLANLANSEGNKVTIFERSTLMEATMKVATLDKAESAREYASAVLMDLSSCPANQVAMARMDKVLATLVKLAVVEDKVETREYAVSGLQNIAFEKENRMQLVSYGNGVVIEALKKCTSSDPNDKTRRRSAGALTNLACDETAEKLANHTGLLKVLAQASVSDKNKDVRQRATLALTKLANSITVKMSCWDTLLDALITSSQCTVADGIVSAMFRVKTRAEENRTSMANHPHLLETLAQLCLRTKDNVIDNEKSAYKDCENATKAIAHLANDPLNHKLICNKHILSALVHGASLAGKAGVVTRDASILALERLAMEHSNRPMMARYPGMLVSIAKATEREMNEELKGLPASSVTGQPRLAKPLLMSLLVAM